jgi:hypothetical protein
MITTCPSALKKLMAKSALYGGASEAHASTQLVLDQQTHTSSAITFTAEFVKYYFGALTIWSLLSQW